MSLNTYKVTFKLRRKDWLTGCGRKERTETFIETSVSNVMNRLYSEHGAVEEDLCEIVLVRQKSMTDEGRLQEKRQQARWAAEDAKSKKYNTEYNRQQMIDSCEGEF